MSTVLVTGVGGFVGAAIAKRLREQGDFVVGVTKGVRRDMPFAGNYLFVSDVTNVGDLYALLVKFRIEKVYHLAAMSIVAKCQDDPLSAWQTNVLGTVAVLEACRRYAKTGRSADVVIAATDKVYGDGAVPYREDQPLLGIQTYPASKAAADLAARSYAATYGLNVRIVRSANVFGPGDLEESRLIPASIARMLSGKPAVLYSSAAEMVREFVYIDDEVDAYLTVMDRGKSGAYNVPGSGPVKVAEVLETLADLCDGKIVVKETSIQEIREQYLDGSRLGALGWKASVPLREGLEKTVEWFKSRMPNKTAVASL